MGPMFYIAAQTFKLCLVGMVLVGIGAAADWLGLMMLGAWLTVPFTALCLVVLAAWAAGTIIGAAVSLAAAAARWIGRRGG